uniref:Type III pantothenate kinase n=1 Tax=Candidatus Kentrum sp. MB TaxID=2138164 RepID=A0A450XNM7_9GAMM|nr:MAG: type III pantothenate kinase [Candidatus Kentron sp. MB]VFK30933.1 MAG: type III pantothenate kinase [Candidatus Kentron sp. MB]VFK75730.1 MAG: type III pantothenate kinase [Candidatus Kentron sp. MB]
MNSPCAVLVLDVGNTRMKWAHVVKDGLVDYGDATYTVGQLSKILDKRWRAMEPPCRLVVSNVGKEGVEEALSKWTTGNWTLQPEYITTKEKASGVVCAYRDTDTFGADRWMALIAAHRKFKEPVCVVDCGTAITVDALAEDGKHVGGLIVPGIGLMRRTLSRGTGRIGKMPEDNAMAAAQNTWLGRSTQEGIMAGTMWTAVAFIDRVVADLEAEFRKPVTCVVAGGDAQAICPLLACKAVCEPDLVLQGLAIMANQNND